MRNRALRSVVFACLAAFSTVVARPASANVFALDGKDPRAATPRTGEDRVYAPVGIIVTGGKVAASEDGKKMIRTRGSAFLVSPCYALTNYHAVFGLAYDGPGPDQDHTAVFSVGADPDYMFHWTVKATPVRWGAFNRKKEHDWALLKLEACVGGQPDVGWLDLMAQSGPSMMGEDVSLAGYPADKTGNSLWVQATCKIRAMQDGTAKVLHGCSVHGGASGGPLIGKGKTGAAAVAIQCGELNAVSGPLERWDPRHANTAVTVAEVLQDPEAKALIEADLAAFPGVNPALSTSVEDEMPPVETAPDALDPTPEPEAPPPAAEARTVIAGLL